MTTLTPPQPAGRVRSVPATGPLTGWRVVDLVTAAVLGVAFGAVFLAWGGVYTLLAPLTTAFQPAEGLGAGLFFAPAVVGALVVRRPGAALLTELVAAFVEMALGNHWGATVMLSGLLQGLGAELAFALVLWRRWSLLVAVLAGIGAGVVELVAYEWWSYYAGQSWVFKLAYLGFTAVSGAVIAGLGSWVLVRALASTGALSAFPPGVEHAERAV